ncbi:MAG: helix-turn-helix transcriptional regulator [Defluviitaleaceae bacterium]|nr:helix-turn-helix transcriptional regulator [Defluviitaleaceae bacterium]MCL2239884.1 helix-turn-helix transcriptional regulator [Defluviitaleaceae bacterium]
MELMHKLVAIKKKRNLSMEDIASKMNYSKKYIQQMEKGAKPLSKEFFVKYRELLNATDVPLTLDEETQYKKALYRWMDAFLLNELEKASEQYPWLKKCAELTINTDIKNLFHIFEAAFFRKTNNDEALEASMSNLAKKADGFTPEQSHWYNRQVAIYAMKNFQYREAIQAFLQAEEQGEKEKLNDYALFYNIGHCLTDMGFAHKAIYYLEKARADAINRHQTKHNEYIKYFLAENYNEVGRSQEALMLLESCLQNEQVKKDASTIVALIYRRIAMVYLKMGDFQKSLECINESFNHITIDKSAYEINLYFKAVILIAQNKINEGIVCVQKCIEMENEGTLHYVIYNTLLHSTSLRRAESLNYLENVAIPELIKHQHYITLMDCYQKLSMHFKNSKKIKMAYKYSELTFKLSEKLRKGDLS